MNVKGLKFLLLAVILISMGAFAINTDEADNAVKIDPVSKLSSDMNGIDSSGDEMVSLIVQFSNGPEDRDIHFIEDIGFSIRRTFTAVSVFSISTQFPFPASYMFLIVFVS